jgi:hypothetical protein
MATSKAPAPKDAPAPEPKVVVREVVREVVRYVDHSDLTPEEQARKRNLE